jgi:hypothetical protein
LVPSALCTVSHDWSAFQCASPRSTLTAPHLLYHKARDDIRAMNYLVTEFDARTMAELLGAIASGITLVGLLKVCVEAFDVIQHARQQDLDYRKLALRLNIEKCRLYTWGEAMGLTELPRGDSARPLEGHRFEPLIRETLEMIVMLFNDSEKLKDVYGCRSDIEQVRLPTAIESDSIDKLAAAFKNFRIKCPTTD